MTTRTVRTFFFAAFAVSWEAGLHFTTFPAQVEALFGSMGYTSPAFILIAVTTAAPPECQASEG